MKKCREDKCNLLNLIKEIALTKEHFTEYQFKYIILLNFDHSNDYFQKGLKSYLDQYGVIFIFLCSKFSKIQKYILSHVVQIRIKVPLTYEKNKCIMINQSYQNQLRILHQWQFYCCHQNHSLLVLYYLYHHLSWSHYHQRFLPPHKTHCLQD